MLGADAILLWQGAYLSAALLTARFVAVVMTADNLIRPDFSSQGKNLPALIAFLGTVGGFPARGLIGVYLGPVLTSVICKMLLARMESETEEMG